MRSVIEAEMANGSSWMALLQIPDNRRRMLVVVLLGLFSQWSGNGAGFFLPCSRSRDGRHHQLQAREHYQRLSDDIQLDHGGSVGLCFRLPPPPYAVSGAGYGVLAMLFLFYFFFNFAFNALLYSYHVEDLPYSIRAKGFSVLMFFWKGASFVNAFLNPIDLQVLAWKFYAVYVGWLCVEVFCVYMFFPEASGRSLEGIAEVFDGPPSADERMRAEK
ncbi:hypothetical protein FOMG_18887 [Fusarium oxysporum f. sp. melonis 26406]|uniref:Major facilitator superfamily (MFS) profile domain-containing protein n=1 Tax=Fusarium oxysporum f. sp. melonis 26406 TaxID=1089452 RepID=W9YYZ4_FUSOX|nr:hypothetical protein FOMG_18887 [Fusarium oxysporum f. sp. melonis 26406]